MQIKKNLKLLDIKKSKLAYDLGVSRPTLDTYIDCYENGHAIPNEGYQKIFNYLFSGEEISSIEFAQRYDYVKRVMLNDAKNEVAKSKAYKRQDIILKNIQDILHSGTLDQSVVEFINLFINNKNNELVKAIYLYFNFTNGFINISDYKLSDKDKALYSQMFKLFKDYNDDNIEMLTIYFEKVKEKSKKNFEKKQFKVNDSDIVEYIKNNLADSSNIDIEVLKEMINSREVK